MKSSNFLKEISVVEKCFYELWEYLTLRDALTPSDAIFVFGRDDFMIASKALELYKKEISSTLVLLGGRGRMSGKLNIAESEAFRRFLSENGVPEHAMLTESNSTNTEENIAEGLRLLHENSIVVHKIILITHAPHSRRALATAQKKSREINFLSCPDDCVLPSPDLSMRIAAAEELLGEVERLIRYSQLGYIEKQILPTNIKKCTTILNESLNKKLN